VSVPLAFRSAGLRPAFRSVSVPLALFTSSILLAQLSEISILDRRLNAAFPERLKVTLLYKLLQNPDDKTSVVDISQTTTALSEPLGERKKTWLR
jgi:hypothetical protein